MPILRKLCPTIGEEGTLPNSFHEASITLTPKTDRHKERKLQANVPYRY